MKIISLILMAVLVAVDQLVKMLVVMYLKTIGEITVIDGFLELNYVENTGATFGIFQGMSWIIVIFAVIVSIVALVVFLKYNNHNIFTYYSAITIVAGGIGNIIDRIVFGYVIDYIHFMFFPYVFNFADCMVVTGVIVFMIYYIFLYGKDTHLEQNTENYKILVEEVDNETKN